MQNGTDTDDIDFSKYGNIFNTLLEQEGIYLMPFAASVKRTLSITVG